MPLPFGRKHRSRHVHRWVRFTPKTKTLGGTETWPGEWWRCSDCGEPGFHASPEAIERMRRRFAS